MQGGQAKIQLLEEQWDLMQQVRKKVLDELKKYYESVTIDLETRKSSL